MQQNPQRETLIWVVLGALSLSCGVIGAALNFQPVAFPFWAAYGFFLEIMVTRIVLRRRRHNAFRNCKFEIWQRGTGFLDAGFYQIDGWIMAPGAMLQEFDFADRS